MQIYFENRFFLFEMPFRRTVDSTSSFLQWGRSNLVHTLQSKVTEPWFTNRGSGRILLRTLGPRRPHIHNSHILGLATTSLIYATGHAYTHTHTHTHPPKLLRKLSRRERFHIMAGASFSCNDAKKSLLWIFVCNGRPHTLHTKINFQVFFRLLEISNAMQK